jgi:hypothetical protein
MPWLGPTFWAFFLGELTGIGLLALVQWIK